MSDYDLIGGPTTDEHGWGWINGVLTTHVPKQCEGSYCVIHNPSDHHMRSWPSLWRDDRKLMERNCPHGVGHPDPDALAYEVSQGRNWQGVHGCDGCCTPPEKES